MFESPLSRRAFVQQTMHAGTTTAVLGGLPHWSSRVLPRRSTIQARVAAQAQGVDPHQVQALALRAIEAARAAGARYADVRLTRTVRQSYSNGDREATYGDDLRQTTGGGVDDIETIAVGIRALVDGYWGFAASLYWTLDEMVQLARLAVTQAKANAAVHPRAVDLGVIPVVTGTWATPIAIDPFRISIEEKLDFLATWRQVVLDTAVPGRVVVPDESRMSFQRQEQAMATSEGSYVTQTLYNSAGIFPVVVTSAEGRKQGRGVTVSADGLQLSGKGWELFLDAKISQQVPTLLEQAAEEIALPVKPIEAGRYTAVCSGATIAAMMVRTFGVATQLDRALGYEANAGGASYLGPDPLAMLGTAVASPLVTVTANRSLSGGLATVQWDDDGIVPTDFTLVQQGELVDYQTTREQAAWLAPWYQKRGVPVRAHGCALAPSAFYLPLSHTPNLALAPSATTASFDELVGNVQHGVAILGASINTDFQAMSGGGPAIVREIRQGKLGATFAGAGMLFTATNFWKNLTALGGASSAVAGVGSDVKGQPAQEASYTVMAVPAIVKDVAIVDARRRA